MSSPSAGELASASSTSSPSSHPSGSFPPPGGMSPSAPRGSSIAHFGATTFGDGERVFFCLAFPVFQFLAKLKSPGANSGGGVLLFLRRHNHHHFLPRCVKTTLRQKETICQDG